jgi:hypothetical protein
MLLTIRRSLATATIGSNVGRFILILAIMFGGWTSASLAMPYDFLTVSGNNVSGNGAFSTFTSNNGNGVINVTHFFPSSGGAGGLDNINTAIYPSQFTTLFPGTGLVQGHLAMTVYDNTSQVTFDLTGYTGYLPELVFGIWNTTDEVTLPAYNIQLLNSTNVFVPPAMFNYIGNQDNQTQVAGRHKMQLNTLTGDITAPTLINAGGIHTDAMFFDGVPTGTQQIVVTAHLGPLNTIGDGVGYYFAETVPEPSSFALFALGFVSIGVMRYYRRNNWGQSKV